MRKLISQVTSLLLVISFALGSTVNPSRRVYAYDEEMVLFCCDESEQDEISIIDDNSSDCESEICVIDELEEPSEDENVIYDEENLFMGQLSGDVSNNAGDLSYSYPTEGVCGDYATWYLDIKEADDNDKYERAFLYIGGQGAMYDYSATNPAPWSWYKKPIIEVSISQDITEIGDYAFYRLNSYNTKRIGSITFPEEMDRIGKYSFYDTDVEKFILPEHIGTIDEYAFYYDYGAQIVFPQSVSKIGQFAFFGDRFYEPIVLYGTEEVEKNAFGGAIIQEIKLCSGVRICEHAFYNASIECKDLVVPNDVAEIGNEAFCGLSSVKFEGKWPEKLGRNVFSNPSDNCLTILYPKEMQEWGDFLKKADGGIWATNARISYETHKTMITVLFYDPYGNVVSEDYNVGSKLIFPDINLQDGDEIFGWYTDKNDQSEENRWTEERLAYVDLALYARLENTDCSIKFETGCGTIIPDQVVKGGFTAVNPGILTQDDKLFSKWVVKGNSDEEMLMAKPFDFDAPIYEDITLVAVWVDFGCIKVEGVSDCTYTGYPITFSNLQVSVDRHLMEQGRDYKVEYKNNKNVGEGIVVITLKGNYSGTCTETFKINKAQISEDCDKMQVTVEKADCTLMYNGSVQKAKPVLKLKTGEKSYTLKLGKDYELRYEGTDKKSVNYNPAAFKEPGEYKIWYVGKGNFEGEACFTEAITKKCDISKASVKIVGSCNYTGEPVRPEVIVKYGNKVLIGNEEDNADYKVEYEDCINSGVATVHIYAAEDSDYFGEKTLHYKITGIPIGKATIAGIESKVFTGDEQTLEGLIVSYSGKVLKGVLNSEYDGGDYSDYSYTYEYQNNRNAGSAKVIIRGINDFSGTITKSFKIDRQDIKNLDVVNVQKQVEYDYKGAKPEILLVLGDYLLVEGKDYTLKYAGNKKIGTAVAKISGKGNFAGSISEEFEIIKTDISSFDITVDDVSYRKTPFLKQPAIIIYDNDGNKLRIGKDISKNITYRYALTCVVQVNGNSVERKTGEIVDKKDCLEAGTALECLVSGDNGYFGQIVGSFRIAKASIGTAKVKVYNQTYNEKPIIPDKGDICVKVGKTILSNDDYDIIGCDNNVKAGTATIRFRGKGNYGGIKTATFKIKARGVGLNVYFEDLFSKLLVK